MINVGMVLCILFVHWFADFVLQTDSQAKEKSSSNMALTGHVLMYTVVWMLFITISVMITENVNLLWFIPITFVSHWITDYFTSRLNKKLWNKGNTHTFFVSVGFDQFLHYIQLFLTYYFLS